MLTTSQALELLLAAAMPVTETDEVDTMDANGRVLAATRHSQLDVPPLDNSQMDGYAVRVADCAVAGAVLPVSQRIAAGQVGTPLAAGTAARIFTGAPVPFGADAIVMQEQCVSSRAENGETITVDHVPAPNEWIRPRGEDIRAGSEILAAGTRLGPAELGLAASVGLATLPVTRRLRVAVFFTGDELAMPGETLKPGAIYNSNRFTLYTLLANLGCEIADFGIVPDTLEATRATLRRAALGNDLILTSGGVSVGEEDHVRPAVEAEGQINMWQIAMKPGKPLAFGEVNRGVPGVDVAEVIAESAVTDADPAASKAFFIGLPGNPVSSLVTFLLFVRPFVLRLQGVENVAPKRLRLRADFSLPKADRRNEFLRARINAEGGLDLFPNQGSGVLTSIVWGDGLIDNPPGQVIAAGDMVDFIPFGELS